MLAAWLPLTYALNPINRSMGRDDLYPFVLPPPVMDKLALVHELVAGELTGATSRVARSRRPGRRSRTAASSGRRIRPRDRERRRRRSSPEAESNSTVERVASIARRPTGRRALGERWRRSRRARPSPAPA